VGGVSAHEVLVDAITGDPDLAIGQFDAAVAATFALKALEGAGYIVPEGWKVELTTADSATAPHSPPCVGEPRLVQR